MTKSRFGRPKKALDFFEANPGAELSVRDALHKFGVTKHYSSDFFRGLKKDGIEVVKIVRRKP